MSSFFSFSLGSAPPREQPNHHQVDDADKLLLQQLASDSAIPDVAPSKTDDETLESPSVAGLKADDESIDDSFHTARDAPPTPDGLKPRTPLLQLRKQLDVSDRAIASATNAMKNETARTTAAVRAKRFISILPPHPPTGTYGTSVAMAHSPQVSNSSFYNDSSLEPVAESPNLAQPTTAVGALVASANNAFGSSVPPTTQHPSTSHLLPPKQWLHREPFAYQELQDDDDTTLSSWQLKTSLMAHNHDDDEEESPTRRYNFDPILHLNVSAISAAVDDQSSLQSSIVQTDDDDDEEAESALLRRKRWNQRTSKERLLTDCLERLSGDLDLVQAVEELGVDDSSWFIKTERTQPGLLTGFPPDLKARLVGQLNGLVQELTTYPQEELFFASPTQVQEYSNSHTELLKAVKFVLMLLNQQPLGGWQCKYDVRTEMGLGDLTVPSPPVCRGGDTSLFSLPEDSLTATPYTSNVSMTTSLTSKPESPKTTARGTHLVRTIQILSTLFGRLSQSLTDLLESSTPMGAEELKRVHFQLLSLSPMDLQRLCDAFYPTVTAPMVIRTVSADEEEEEGPRRNWQTMFHPPPEDTKQHDDGHPAIVEDDLRRTVGSNDYDRNDCREDAPRDGDDDERVQDFYHPTECRV